MFFTNPPRRGRRSTRSVASSSRKAFWMVLTLTPYVAASSRVVGTRSPRGHCPLLILSQNSRASRRESPSVMRQLPMLYEQRQVQRCHLYQPYANRILRNDRFCSFWTQKSHLVYDLV